MCQKYAAKMDTVFARAARSTKYTSQSKDYDLLLKGEVEADNPILAVNAKDQEA